MVLSTVTYFVRYRYNASNAKTETASDTYNGNGYTTFKTDATVTETYFGSRYFAAPTHYVRDSAEVSDAYYWNSDIAAVT